MAPSTLSAVLVVPIGPQIVGGTTATVVAVAAETEATVIETETAPGTDTETETVAATPLAIGTATAIVTMTVAEKDTKTTTTEETRNAGALPTWMNVRLAHFLPSETVPPDVVGLAALLHTNANLLPTRNLPPRNTTPTNPLPTTRKRDPCYFFEEKLGEGSVMDSRIVTDRMSRRSKGIAYVEFRTVELVDKAIDLTGTIVMGRPIHIQHTEAERNRLHAGDGTLHLPPGVTSSHGGTMQLYVGSLQFNLSEADIKQVFEPFGELEFVDLHKDPATGRSKGYAFVQYRRPEDAKMALEQMDGFELAGRTLRVNTVHEKGTAARYTIAAESLDDAGGGNLNAASRQALMQKLARIEPVQAPDLVSRLNIPKSMDSRSVLIKNMFNPEQETEPNWDKDLAEDVKGECQDKYGKVEAIKVEKDSEGEVYIKFDTVDAAKQAVQGLNGRWFGGNQISVTSISDAIMQAHI
ncbi:Splicing factor CC1-like protein [Mycena kentingensis (nom. inval.)]|nr:Splicing factor CC1-like protein [Mycena kentingensis (nom. inval.)]